MRIGEVATAAEVNVQTLRYYERAGLLEKPRRLASGYRAYAPETVQIIRFIKQSRELGYTLAEIKQLLGLRRARQTANAREVRALVQAKISEIEDKIGKLEQMRAELNHLLSTCECGEATLRCPALDRLHL